MIVLLAVVHSTIANHLPNLLVLLFLPFLVRVAHLHQDPSEASREVAQPYQLHVAVEAVEAAMGHSNSAVEVGSHLGSSCPCS